MKIPLKSKIFPILSGVEIGVPINIISKVSTDVNFAHSPLTKESILLNCLLGFSTYKQDRYLDSLEYINNVNNTILNKKHDYYISVVNNEKDVQFTLFCSYIAICIFAIYYHIGVILPLFTSTFTYKYLKQNKHISYLKPFYVAGMWTFCTIAIPILLNDHSLPMSNDIFNAMTPTFLNLFALTNLADLKDYDEDLLNGINTLPIILGPIKTKGIVLLSSILSTIMFINSPYFISNFQNMFYISSNIFPYFSLFNFKNLTN